MSKNPIQDMTDIYVKKVAAYNKGEYMKNWEDLGGPTPGNYNTTDDSAKLKQEALVEPKIKGYEKKANAITRKAAFRPFNKEGFSDWRSEGLFEVISRPTTDVQALKKVTEKKVNNKVEINPKLKEAVAEMGGHIIEVTDATLKDQEKSVYDTEKKDAFANQLKSKEQRQKMIKKQVLLKKLQAVRAGAHQDITASYEPDIEGTVEYFYEEGINEEGFDQFIEEIGLEAFVDFVEGGAVELNEARAARRATVRAKKYDVVKKEVDKADAARKAAKKGEYAPSYAKKETDVTVYDDKPSAKKKAAPAKKATAPKKPATPKVAPRPAAPKKPVTQKVVKAVAKVKKTQPAKKPSKAGLADKIRTAYKKGMERHKAARAKGRVPEKRAREFASGVKSGVKTAVKFARDVKKVVSEESQCDCDCGQDPCVKCGESHHTVSEGVKKKKKGHNCASKVKHEEYGMGRCIKEMHTLDEDGQVTHYDVMFSNKIIKNIPVSSLEIIEGMFHEHVINDEKNMEVKRIKEDKALEIVRANIIKKHGKGAIYDPKTAKKPSEADKVRAAAERKRRQDADNKAFASRAKKAGYKNPQDYANVVARYGGEDNMKKGRGLGT